MTSSLIALAPNFTNAADTLPSFKAICAATQSISSEPNGLITFQFGECTVIEKSPAFDPRRVETEGAFVTLPERTDGDLEDYRLIIRALVQAAEAGLPVILGGVYENTVDMVSGWRLHSVTVRGETLVRGDDFPAGLDGGIFLRLRMEFSGFFDLPAHSHQSVR